MRRNPYSIVNLRDLVGQLDEAHSHRAEAQEELHRRTTAYEESSGEVLTALQHARLEADSASSPELVGLARHLYWRHPGVPALKIARAMGFGIADLLAAIGPTPSGLHCADCGTELMRTSRSWTPAQWTGVDGYLCPECRQAREEHRQRQNSVYWMRRRLVSETPVETFTADWLFAAALVLSYPPVTRNVERGSEADYREGVWGDWENAESVKKLLEGAAGSETHSALPLKQAEPLVRSAQGAAEWDSLHALSLAERNRLPSAQIALARLEKVVKAAKAEAEARAAARYPEGYVPTREEIRHASQASL